MRSRSAWRVLLALIALALVAVGASAAVIAKSPAADFVVSAVPTRLAVAPGASGHYALHVTPLNGFNGSVSLAASGIPSGVTTNLTNNPSHLQADSMLTIFTTSGVRAGDYPITVTGTSGKLKHATQIVLTVLKPSFTVAVTPANTNVFAGSGGSFAVNLSRTALTAPISLSINGLPAHASATFSPATTAGNTATLSVMTGATTPLGSYTLLIKGISGTIAATTTTHLTVSAAGGKPFTIAGTADRLLSPGRTGYLNLALTNPNHQALSVTSLVVAIVGTSRTACAVSGNFATVQFSGSYPLAVPAGATRTLSQLGVPQAGWPKVSMINLPSNQDSCKNTSLTLGFTGTGSGN